MADRDRAAIHIHAFWIEPHPGLYAGVESAGALQQGLDELYWRDLPTSDRPRGLETG